MRKAVSDGTYYGRVRPPNLNHINMKETWSNKKDVIALINFIVSKELTLDNYYSLIPKIQANFQVHKRGKWLTQFHNDLIDAIIDWENGNQNSTLERMIDREFLIYKVK